ncbi:MAG TPA: RNA-binding domain-containing protein [Blastocatellia bacterium]|nr:RNA-binding domain-containing protein [Blastocatellia bacterium]
MARRRFSRHQRPESERSLYEQTIYTSHTLHKQEIINLIRGGEDTYTEFKVRLSNPEKITAEIIALANTGGGAMIFGVDDKRRVEGLDNIEAVEEQLVEICRHHIVPPIVPFIDKVAFDNGKRIIVFEMRASQTPYSTLDGRFYIRIGSAKQEATREELMQLYNDSRPAEFENLPLITASLNDIDEAHLWSYVRALRGAEFGRKDDYPTTVVLKDMGLAVNYPGPESIDVVPTLCGLLLFGYFLRVPEVFPRSSIVATRYSGTTLTDPIIERTEISGNLSVIFERTMNFIGRYADLWPSGVSRNAQTSVNAKADPEIVVARGNYHQGVVIEGLTNALVHRDYSMRDVHTRISIFDNRIEMINPCRYRMLPIESIKYGTVSAANPLLKAIFTNPLYGLKLAQGGVPSMLQEGKAFAGHAPEIKIINGEFRLRLDAS